MSEFKPLSKQLVWIDCDNTFLHAIINTGSNKDKNCKLLFTNTFGMDLFVQIGTYQRNDRRR